MRYGGSCPEYMFYAPAVQNNSSRHIAFAKVQLVPIPMCPMFNFSFFGLDLQYLHEPFNKAKLQGYVLVFLLPNLDMLFWTFSKKTSGHVCLDMFTRSN